MAFLGVDGTTSWDDTEHRFAATPSQGDVVGSKETGPETGEESVQVNLTLDSVPHVLVEAISCSGAGKVEGYFEALSLRRK